MHIGFKKKDLPPANAGGKPFGSDVSRIIMPQASLMSSVTGTLSTNLLQ